MKKRYMIPFLILAAIFPFAVRYCQGKQKAEEALAGFPAPAANVVVGERLAKQIEAVNSFSLDESIRNLYKMEFYDWPGAFIGAGTMSLLDEKGRLTAESRYEQDSIDLKQILSSRLFRKCCQDLQKLPKDQAAKIVKKELEAALTAYFKLYDKFFQLRSRDCMILEFKDGSPAVPGLRFKVFALVLLAGTLELTEGHEIIVKIISDSEEQFTKLPQLNDRSLEINYADVGLRNNLILASGLYGTSPHKSAEKLKPFADRFAEHKLVDFSAPATEYDFLAVRGMAKVVPDKGYIHLRFFDKMADEDYHTLRQFAGKPQ